MLLLNNENTSPFFITWNGPPSKEEVVKDPEYERTPCFLYQI